MGSIEAVGCITNGCIPVETERARVGLMCERLSRSLPVVPTLPAGSLAWSACYLQRAGRRKTWLAEHGGRQSGERRWVSSPSRSSVSLVWWAAQEIPHGARVWTVGAVSWQSWWWIPISHPFALCLLVLGQQSIAKSHSGKAKRRPKWTPTANDMTPRGCP